MLKRIFIFAILCGAIWTGDYFYESSVQPNTTSHAAVAALNGGDAEADRLRGMQRVNNLVPLVSAGLTAAVALGCFAPLFRRNIQRKESNHA